MNYDPTAPVAKQDVQRSRARLLLDLVAYAASKERCINTRARLLDACAKELPAVRARGLSSVPYLGLAEVPAAPALERWVWRQQRKAILELLVEAGARGLDIAVLKGAEMCERFFSSQPLGLKSDVDILVAREQELGIRQLLAELDYTQSDYDASQGCLVACSADDLRRHELGNYSLKSFVKLVTVEASLHDALSVGFHYPLHLSENGARMLVVVDVALGLDKSLGFDAVRPRLVTSAIAGGMTLSLEDHYWYLCTLFYLKMFFDRDRARLGQLCEIAALLTYGADRFDWGYVAGTAHRLDIFPGLYYVTAFLHRRLGIPLPDQVLALLDPRRGSRARDFGWQFPKAFGLLDDFPALDGVGS